MFVIPHLLQRGETQFASSLYVFFFITGVRHEGQHDANCKYISFFLNFFWFMRKEEQPVCCAFHFEANRAKESLCLSSSIIYNAKALSIQIASILLI